MVNIPLKIFSQSQEEHTLNIITSWTSQLNVSLPLLYHTTPDPQYPNQSARYSRSRLRGPMASAPSRIPPRRTLRRWISVCCSFPPIVFLRLRVLRKPRLKSPSRRRPPTKSVQVILVDVLFRDPTARPGPHASEGVSWENGTAYSRVP